ncbi:MAG: alpha/beta hydrolase [Planctomycetes bacterium]|nr:alpha/beta hydrolase [Planctomycetota bacterium]
MSAVPEKILFKNTPQVPLHLYLFKPESTAQSAIVFFVCGGWSGFRTAKHYPQAAYFQSRGLLCAVAEVRISDHGTGPRECVIDAKSAIRFVRAHAKEWGFPSDKIVAAGGSAAGHVSLSCAMLEDVEDENDNRDISSVPNLVCAYNPAVLPPIEQANTTPALMEKRIKFFGSIEERSALSPSQAIRPGIAPTLLLHGDADEITPLSDTEYFHQHMLAAGNSSTLHIYPGEGHGFFNFFDGDNPHFIETTRDVDQFLVDQEFLSGAATIDSFHYSGES